MTTQKNLWDVLLTKGEEERAQAWPWPTYPGVVGPFDGAEEAGDHAARVTHLPVEDVVARPHCDDPAYDFPSVEATLAREGVSYVFQRHAEGGQPDATHVENDQGLCLVVANATAWRCYENLLADGWIEE